MPPQPKQRNKPRQTKHPGYSQGIGKRGQLSARVKPRSGWVYVVASKGSPEFKVGRTTNKQHVRLSELQIGNPNQLRIVKTFKSTHVVNAERMMHAALHPWWKRGEWFLCPMAIINEAWKQVRVEWPDHEASPEKWDAAYARMEQWGRARHAATTSPVPAPEPARPRRKPAPELNMRARLGLILPPTREEIHAAAKKPGGFTRVMLAEWGVPWPPPAGWIDRLEFRRATIERKMARQAAARPTPPV